MNRLRRQNGGVEIANTVKMRPRTKHVAIKHHHFGTCVSKGHIKIVKVDTSEQEAGSFNKTLAPTTILLFQEEGSRLAINVVFIPPSLGT